MLNLKLFIKMESQNIRNQNSHSVSLPKVADQEALPFKMIYGLQELGARIFIQPESCHGMWNDTKNAVRRSGKQYCLLLSLTMSNMAHGPFGSGKNAQSLLEAAESLAHTISEDDFANLCDSMAMDLNCELDDPRIPQSAADIKNLPIFHHLPIYATWFFEIKSTLRSYISELFTSNNFLMNERLLG